MATIKDRLLEKAEFGTFQKENQEALATLDKEKRNLRVKRKLKEAQSREKQVKFKFSPDAGGGDFKIKVGNQVNPVQGYYGYFRTPKNKFPQTKPKIEVAEIFSGKPAWQDRQYYDDLTSVQNKIFKPSQLKKILGEIKKAYPKADYLYGERQTGMRPRGATQKLALKGKKFGLFGLGLSLNEAIKAGMAAYDAKEGKM